MGTAAAWGVTTCGLEILISLTVETTDEGWILKHSPMQKLETVGIRIRIFLNPILPVPSLPDAVYVFRAMHCKPDP